jgi:hypothetical protein
MSEISIEHTESGRTVLTLEKGDGKAKSWVLDKNIDPTQFNAVVPYDIMVALIERVEFLQAPPWQGLDKVAKAQVLNVVKWIAFEVTK